MSEWLTDKEKRLLFSALTREKKVCAEVDKESCREPYEESLVSVVESLEHKFYYDRLFKQMEKQGRADAIVELLKVITDNSYKIEEDYTVREFARVCIWEDDLQKITEQLKGTDKIGDK